jgi:hypothetical protein
MRTAIYMLLTLNVVMSANVALQLRNYYSFLKCCYNRFRHESPVFSNTNKRAWFHVPCIACTTQHCYKEGSELNILTLHFLQERERYHL